MFYLFRYLVRLGETDFRVDTGKTVDIQIAKTVYHEDYNRRTRVADIAIIYLEKDATLTRESNVH